MAEVSERDRKKMEALIEQKEQELRDITKLRMSTLEEEVRKLEAQVISCHDLMQFS